MIVFFLFFIHFAFSLAHLVSSRLISFRFICSVWNSFLGCLDNFSSAFHRFQTWDISFGNWVGVLQLSMMRKQIHYCWLFICKNGWISVDLTVLSCEPNDKRVPNVFCCRNDFRCFEISAANRRSSRIWCALNKTNLLRSDRPLWRVKHLH